MKWSLCTTTIISSILVNGSLNILNINVRFAIVPSPSVGEFFLQGRVRVTSPFFFSVTRLLVSLFLRFSQRGVHARARCVRKNSNCSECLTCHHPPEMPVCPGHSHRSLGRLSISEHFDLVSTRCNRWQMFENYFIIIFSNVNPRTYTQIHTTRPAQKIMR